MGERSSQSMAITLVFSKQGGGLRFFPFSFTFLLLCIEMSFAAHVPGEGGTERERKGKKHFVRDCPLTSRF